MADQNNGNISSPEQLDKQIDKNIQKRELTKMQGMFYQSLKDHYGSRKYQEEIVMTCSQKCMRGFHDDDLERSEKACLQNCFHKYYRFLMYSSSIYHYLSKEGEETPQESLEGSPE